PRHARLPDLPHPDGRGRPDRPRLHRARRRLRGLPRRGRPAPRPVRRRGRRHRLRDLPRHGGLHHRRLRPRADAVPARRGARAPGLWHVSPRRNHPRRAVLRPLQTPRHRLRRLPRRRVIVWTCDRADVWTMRGLLALGALLVLCGFAEPAPADSLVYLDLLPARTSALLDPPRTTARKPGASHPHGDIAFPCEACHTPNAWTPLHDPLLFDHSEETRFVMTGRHEQLACAS